MSPLPQLDQGELSIPQEDPKIPESRKAVTFLAYREKAFRTLEDHGMMKRDDEGRIICDTDRLKGNFDYDVLRSKLGPICSRREYGDGRMIESLYWIFKDLNVYSKRDYEQVKQGEAVEPKPLFYEPEDNDAALDINTIKNSKFHMGIWELGDKRILPLKYPTKQDGLDSDLSIYEGTVACLLYHPKYGNGERGEDGRLMVDFNKEYIQRFYSGDTNRRPISGSFFESWGYYGAPDRRPLENGKRSNQSLIDKPVKFFMERCPDMIEKGLIEPFRDFRIEYTDSEFGSNLRHPTNRGLVTVGFSPETRRRYTLGSEYEGKRGYSVYPLSEKYAAILKHTGNGSYDLEKVFELKTDPLTAEEKDQVRFSRSTINKSEITFIEPQDLESLAVNDGVLVSNFKDFLAFSQKTSQEAGFPLVNLSVKEKSLATALYLQYGNEPKLWQFIQKYKLNGLRSLMAVESAHENAAQIWELGERMGSTKLFSEVADIVQSVSRYEDSIRTKLSDKERTEADEVARVIMDATSKYLLSALPVLKEDEKVKGILSIGDVERSISSLRERVTRMYADKYGIQIEDDLYTKILTVCESGSLDDPNVQALARAALQEQWLKDINEEDASQVKKVVAATETFYAGNDELFERANETTGDTQKQLDHFRRFLATENIEGRAPGVTLDMGSGDGERITRPMSEMVAGMVIGIDRLPPSIPSQNNLHFAQGDFTHIPMFPNTVDLVTAHWSVINDLTARSMQMDSFQEIARVLKPGGNFYFDVPYLEGEGGWGDAANEYHKSHGDTPYGMIHATFPGNRTKEFYIYPEEELNALLHNAGFELTQSDVWYTDSGMPRRTVAAKLINKVTPFQLAA